MKSPFNFSVGSLPFEKLKIGTPAIFFIHYPTILGTQSTSRDQVREMCEFQANLRLCTIRPLTTDDDLPSIYEDMVVLCKMFFPDELRHEMENLQVARGD